MVIEVFNTIDPWIWVTIGAMLIENLPIEPQYRSSDLPCSQWPIIHFSPRDIRETHFDFASLIAMEDVQLFCLRIL